MNLLFLPLLLCGKRNESVCVLNNQEEIHQQGTNTQKIRKCSNIVLFGLVVLIYFSEPIALSIVHENLPKIMTKEYLESIGYDEKCNENVLGNQDYPTEMIKGVAWEWNGSSYNVIGKTTTTTSFVNFFFSFDSLPEWAIPGHTYHAIYEADVVRLRICCYDISGKEILTIETKSSLDFTIPNETVGLIVRISLEPNEPAYESVMPIIYPIHI